MTHAAGWSGLRSHYERDGYVVVPDLFPRHEVAAIKDEIRRILADWRSSGGFTRAKDVGVNVGLSIASARMREVNADPRLVGALQAVMGPDIEFLSDKIVYKTAATDFGSPWHQDWHYWHGAHKVSVWVALDDAMKANGCLKMIPGSHRTISRMDGKADDGNGFDQRMDPKSVDESTAVDLPAPAGTAVIFHDLTLHASYQNTSGADRWALISTYRDASVKDLEYDWAKAAFMVSGTRAA